MGQEDATVPQHDQAVQALLACCCPVSLLCSPHAARALPQALHGAFLQRPSDDPPLHDPPTSLPMQALEQVLLAPEDEHCCVPLDAMLLAHADASLADAVVKHPKTGLEVLEKAMFAAQELMLETHPRRDQMSLKQQAHLRLHGLPYSLDPKPHALNPTIGRIGSSHIGRLIAVCGTVVKTGPVKMFEQLRLLRCNKCKHQ
jgi:DNA replicative helicase MCM subunit Mcm2 (Cdc46/Mcm family)